MCAQVYTFMHSGTCTICENSVRSKNPKYPQVVQAQSVCVHVCACVRVCVCLCVRVCVCDEYGVRAIYIHVTMQVCSCTCTSFVNTV